LEDGKIALTGRNGRYGAYSRVRFGHLDSYGNFQIKAGKSTKVFDGHITVTSKNNELKFVNEVNIDHYVAGVVEGESGISQRYEYYKLQAIICRTYALGNHGRHEDDGYELCDQVHCQVYHKKSVRCDSILLAVDETSDMVLIDDDLELITAAFHSNCGGYTANSENVWLLPKSYLKSVRDTFCIHQPHAKWEKRISKKKWLSYLSTNYKYPVSDSAKCNLALNFNQFKREAYLDDEVKIPLKSVRSDLGLRSSYFSVSDEGTEVRLNGRGFGHGVGLCQEGAMAMAKMKFGYKEIINHYFTNVNLVSLTALKFFLED